MSLDTALAFTLPAEGGFVNNPHDHGGATNHGVTQKVYDAWRNDNGLLPQTVKLISPAEVRQIYAERYWKVGHCDELSQFLAIAHFDWCVNHGPTGAIETLQETLGIDADGIFGPQTRNALLVQDHGDLWDAYNKQRLDWYERDVERDPSQREFLHDWDKRVMQLDEYIQHLETA